MKNLKKAVLAMMSVVALSESASAAQIAETIECEFTKETKSTEPIIKLGTIALKLHDCQSNPLASERKYLRNAPQGQAYVRVELYCTHAEPSMNLVEVQMYEDGKLDLDVIADIPNGIKSMKVFGTNTKHTVRCKVQ